MKLRYDLDSMKPGILASPRPLDSAVDEVDLTLTGGLNSFTLRGSAETIRALLYVSKFVIDYFIDLDKALGLRDFNNTTKFNMFVI